MKSHCRPFALALTLTTVMLGSCGGTKAAEPAFPVAGETRGGFLYPEFQRWRIVRVVPLPDAKIPVDASGVRTILMGRSIYLGAGYFTLPFLNADGEVMMSACFRPTEAGLQAHPLTGKQTEYDQPMMFRALDKGQLSTVLYQMFEATLVREDLLPGEEPGQDSFDRTFNRRLEREAHLVADAPCELKPATVAKLKNGPLELVAPGTARHIVVPDADLDVRTPGIGYSGSQEWRRKLDPALPANNVAGCAGEVFITRLTSGDADGTSSRTEYRLSGGLFGTDSRGTLCARQRFLRRIDPKRLLELLALPPAVHPGLNIPRETPLQLSRWIQDGVFRAMLGDAEIEITVFDEPKIHATLISAPTPKVEPAAVAPAPVMPPLRQEQLRQPARTPTYDARPDAQYDEQPVSEPDDEIHRWVDENGVVHYSDRPRGQ